MIANCHPMIKEWLACFSLLIHHFYSFIGHIFITNTPYIRKSNLLWRKTLAIYYLITITGKEVLHIVKIAIASIKEFHIIPFTSKYTTCSKLILIILAFYHTFPWCGGYAERQSLQSTYGAISRSIKISKKQTLVYQFV